MDDQKWAAFYRSDRANTKKIFIKAMTSDGEHHFFDTTTYEKWFDVIKYCKEKNVIVHELHLQFRSNKCKMDLTGAEGVYVVRSALGSIGQPTKNFITVGILRDDKVYKQMWIVPELLKDKEYEDKLENCFEEAIAYNEQKEAKDREE